MRSHARFRSFLAPDIDQFLAHKRSLGRRYDVEQTTLALFDAYLVDRRIGGLHELTPTVWTNSYSHAHGRARGVIITCALRSAAVLLSGDHEKLTETPLRSAPRRGRYQRTPFIFDAEAASGCSRWRRLCPVRAGRWSEVAPIS